MSHQNDSSDKRTVVDEGTSFEGKLSSSCPIDVRGRIDGDVSTPSLTISKHGAVHGRVKVGSVRSEGEIAGEFEADHVELAGTVKDNTVIRARSLEVKLSAERGRLQVIFGECELSVGDEPTEHVDLPVQAEQAIAAHANGNAAPAPEAPMQLAPSAPEAAGAEMMAIRDPETASVAAPSADVAAPADDAADLDDDDDDDAIVNQAGASERKPRRRRKGKNGASEDAPVTGWSQPPSQPPPAS
jgi:cytoskeletal protein CcmA (bactofilin family)